MSDDSQQADPRSSVQLKRLVSVREKLYKGLSDYHEYCGDYSAGYRDGLADAIKVIREEECLHANELAEGRRQ